MKRSVSFLLFSIASFAWLWCSEGTENPQAPPPQVVVLGIAQDGGIPQIGCTQKVCLTQHHFVTSLAILDGNSIFLIDATPDLREQYQELIRRYPGGQRKLLDGIFLTHAHMGHYTGLIYLGKESISAQKIPVYCSEEMSAYLSQNEPWKFLIDNGNIQLRPFSSGQKLSFQSFSITPLSVPHRKEFTDTFGFLIQGKRKSLLYIPDIDSWDPIRDSISTWLRQSDYALLDGTFYSGKELPGRNMQLVPHPTIQDSMLFFNALPTLECQIIFTHLNHTNLLLDPETPESKQFRSSRFKIADEWSEFEL
jgi:pyrroloquinoline quinone biosynthesis protein B